MYSSIKTIEVFELVKKKKRTLNDRFAQERLGEMSDTLEAGCRAG